MYTLDLFKLFMIDEELIMIMRKYFLELSMILKLLLFIIYKHYINVYNAIQQNFLLGLNSVSKMMIYEYVKK